jgi:tRNA dimethylallyltransferase
MSDAKVVFIIGPTAVGKSKLGIELAQRFNGEIISADSIQVYDHLDIGSAKVTEAEKQGIPHHLVSILPPNRTDFSVKEFSALAKEKIEELSAKNPPKIPIIVGGTFYYVESLLWKSFLSMSEAKSQDGDVEYEDDDGLEEFDVAADIADLKDSSSRMRFVNRLVKAGLSKHQILQRIDPLMANRLHPNDIRKVDRSVEVWALSGSRHSDQIVSARGESPTEDFQLFYENCCVLWIDADKDMLDDRLNKRVEKMIQQGLIEEVKDLYKIMKGQHTSLGLAQSIGFKEFLPYLEFIEQKTFEAVADPVNYQKKLDQVFMECIETLKRATRKYARKQLQWIRNRVLGGPGSAKLAPKLFRFDSTNVQSWDDDVLQPSIQVIDAFLKNDEDAFNPKRFENYCSKLPLHQISRYTSDNLVENWMNYECTVCNKTIHGKHEYDIHMNSRKHRQSVRRKERAPIIEQYKKQKVPNCNDE